MTQRQTYRIMNPANLQDLANQLNNLLALIAERLDRIEGYRGTGLKLSDDEHFDILHGFVKE